MDKNLFGSYTFLPTGSGVRQSSQFILKPMIFRDTLANSSNKNKAVLAQAFIQP